MNTLTRTPASARPSSDQRTRSMVLAAVFAALAAIGAFIQVPLGFTSITLQVLFTCLAGVLLGPKWGAVSQAAYVLLGLAGLPVFTKGGGPGYLVQPSMGFLFGLIALAWVAGMLTRKDRSPLRVALACAAGDLTMYVIALPYMYVVLNFYLGVEKSALDMLRVEVPIYLLGDAIKIAVVAVVSGPLLKAVKRS